MEGSQTPSPRSRLSLSSMFVMDRLLKLLKNDMKSILRSLRYHLGKHVVCRASVIVSSLEALRKAAPHNPDGESHKPDSCTDSCVVCGGLKGRTRSSARCSPSTRLTSEGVTLFDLRTVRLPFLNKCQFVASRWQTAASRMASLCPVTQPFVPR